MEDPLKKRLLGAAVLASLGVLVIPMLIEPPPVVQLAALPKMPPKPARDRFESSLLNSEVPDLKPLPPRPAPVEVRLPAATPGQVDTGQPSAAPAREETGPAAALALAQAKQKEVPRAWIIQVGSFSSKDNATRLVAALREKGFQTLDPEVARINGATHYRVRVGPMADRSQADRLVADVGRISETRPRVIEYP